MTRAIRALLNQAATSATDGEPVPTDIAMKLAAEGYDLTALEGDVEAILAARGDA